MAADAGGPQGAGLTWSSSRWSSSAAWASCSPSSSRSAYKKLRVWEDPRIDVVASMLPNANCGACGLPGCRAFAEQAVEGKIKPAQCTVSGADGVAAIADYLGVDAGQAVKRVARLLCAGGFDVAARPAEYRGLPTCAAAAAVAGGGKGCAWGCLGLGDCARGLRLRCDHDERRRAAGGGSRVSAPRAATA